MVETSQENQFSFSIQDGCQLSLCLFPWMYGPPSLVTLGRILDRWSNSLALNTLIHYPVPTVTTQGNPSLHGITTLSPRPSGWVLSKHVWVYDQSNPIPLDRKRIGGDVSLL